MELHVEPAAGGGLDRGGAVPVGWGGGGGVGEHRWEVGIPFPGSVGAEGGRRWGLHGDVVLGGGNGGGSRRVAFLGKSKEERL